MKKTKAVTHTVSIIRNRGQLTIPDSIRKVVKWITPMSAVSISVTKSDEIVITPHNAPRYKKRRDVIASDYQKQYDWDKIWEGVRKARAIKGKGKAISAAEFLESDRRSH